MTIPIETKLKQFEINLTLSTTVPVELNLAVRDPRFAHTYFLKRTLRMGGNTDHKRDLRISMPLASPLLELDIYSRNGDQFAFSIEDLQIAPLKKPAVWASTEQHRFMHFAYRFAMQAGYAPEGFYRDKSQTYYLQYIEKLTDQMGLPLLTPARIQRNRPFIQIARQQFIHFSIPVRVLILAHEGCHYLLDTRNEKTADFCGLRYYLEAGFPKIEAVYAITKVFRFFDISPQKEQIERAQAAIAFIRQYDSKNHQLRNPLS